MDNMLIELKILKDKVLDKTKPLSEEAALEYNRKSSYVMPWMLPIVMASKVFVRSIRNLDIEKFPLSCRDDLKTLKEVMEEAEKMVEQDDS